MEAKTTTTGIETNSTAEAETPNRIPYLLLPVALAAGVLIGYLIWGRDAAIAQANPDQPAAGEQPAAAQQAQPSSDEPQRFPVDADDDPTYGPADAPIQIIEFADYNCGYCRKFHQETYQVLLETYPGQIQFVYRDFPILGETSLNASIAANCAGDQDMYWEFHDLLYSGRMSLGTEAFTQYAGELNLDSDQFEECINSEKHNAEIIADAELVASFGARGTPVFFINGIPLVGAAPLEQFTTLIDSELEAR